MVNIPLRPAWVQVDLDAIENNARRLKEIIGGDVELMAMVKANAYGHGAVECSRAAVRGGATWLGVYSVGEGLELREAGVTTPTLVVGPTPQEWAHAAFENSLTLTAGSAESALGLAREARGAARPVRVHVKIDTGMTRLGVQAESAVALIRELREEGSLEVEGIYTHFAVADDPNARGIAGWGNEYTRRQLKMFLQVAQELDRAGLGVRYRHAANSPAALNYREARLNLVRSGILVYGLQPSSSVVRPIGVKPALSFKTRIAMVREAPRGTCVSYGCDFVTQRDSRIGVMMIGYADGLRRAPTTYGEVLVCGKRAPIVGRVCMDQTMIDVTDIPEAQTGDEVVLIGSQGAEEISIERVGEKTGTNNYEVVTTISARVPRIYKGGGN
jgi:Alr-MurF fusion protein